MNRNGSLILDVHQVPSLETAIDHWLAARNNFKMLPSNENRRNYEATLNALGVAWNQHYTEASNTPDAFQWYGRGLIAPEEA
jgi:hypothetical protein